MCLQKQKVCFLINLSKSWDSFVNLQLPSDCCLVFLTNYCEKQDTISFRTNLQKRTEVPYMEISRHNDRIRKKTPYMKMSRDNDQKGCVYK